MARLAVLPEQAIIDGFKGVVDFYVYKGQPCARKWPRLARYTRSQAELAGQTAFAYAASSWVTLSAEVRQTYVNMAIGTVLTAREWFMKGYMSGIYRYPTGAP